MTEADLPERPEFENPDSDAARIDQQNSGSMAGGQMGAAGDGNVQSQGDNNSIGNTIYQLFFGQQSPSDVAARPHDETVLLKSVRTEVADRLSQSLHQAVFINLPKDSQRQRVRRPWDTQIKVGNGEQQTLPPEMSIADVFKRDEIGNRLLILGEPGAGKTTTLLDLAQGLTQVAEKDKDCPIPVLFNLSSWKDGSQSQSGKQNSKDGTQWDSIALWLISELKSKYGVSNKLARQWLNEKKLMPLLDGLDEVAPNDQAICLNAINQFLAGDVVPPGLTVCCREKEYELIVASAKKGLQLNGAICLKPLTEVQLQEYLQETGNSQLWQPIHQDEMLLDLVKTPLWLRWLSVLLLAQRGLNLEAWQNQETEADKKQLLLDAYFMQRIPISWQSCEEQPRQYFKGKAPTREQTRRWLVILAKQLQEQSEDEFLIEDMQPRDWLITNKQKWQYRLIVGLIVGLIGGLIVGLTEVLRADIQTKVQPNQGIKLSVKNSLFLLSISTVVALIIRFAAWDLIVTVLGDDIAPGIIGSTLVMLLWYSLDQGGGNAVEKHLALRYTLYLNGSIPWNYARFLNYCTDRLLLQRVGGRYRFIHKLLQEHFANMPIEK